MEHVLYISDLNDLKVYEENKDKYDRVYYGNEFCSNLLPDKKQIRYVLSWSKRYKIPISFVTPCFLTDSDIIKIIELLNIYPKNNEIIFNDWGLFGYIRQSNHIPVHGRMLFSVRKDPRINPECSYADYFKSNNMSYQYQKFLIKNDINRIEFDNLKQGLELNISQKIKSSLYYPFIPITVARDCFFKIDGVCQKKCMGKTIPCIVQNQEVFIKGNVQFYKNNQKPTVNKNWNLDRLVFMPFFPNHNDFDAD